MKPEEQTRLFIEDLLLQAGWVVQDRRRMNLGAGRGVAIREFSASSGPADYLLCVDREAVGTVEAKQMTSPLLEVEEQRAIATTAMYRTASSADYPAERIPLPFTYEITGVETRFTSYLDPNPASRRVFAFHQPATLAAFLKQYPAGAPSEQNNVLRACLRRLPPLSPDRLRVCQVEAITNLERSFAENRPRALIQMTTGSGKTHTSINSIYRLITYGGAKRVLFLVDRANLARQAFNEFSSYATPDDGRKFTELYSVQHLQSNSIDPAARVCITTIQRLYSILSGEPDLDPAKEEGSLFDTNSDDAPAKEVRYNPRIPIETFDVIFTDECHRSIYNKWRGVLEYFDSFIVGLTATPNKQTFSFFERNLVMEYDHARAVADGVNVDYQVYRIQTDIRAKGSTIEALSFIGRRERLTRAMRWEQIDEFFTYAASQLDAQVTTSDQIRTVIRGYRDAIPRLFPDRNGVVPKTLIFAKDDNHAEEIVEIVRSEFGLGNEFAQKITYKTPGKKPEDLIAAFRDSYYPRIAVTVDMIATGTDIKPLEVLLFMRAVKSRSLFEQMKGRGSRTIADEQFQAITPSGGSKTHFIIIDAVGVCEQIKTDNPPLESKASVSLKKVLDDVAVGKWRKDEELLPTLASRLGRLAQYALPEEDAKVRLLCGKNIRELSGGLVNALTPDIQLAIAIQETGQMYLNVNDARVLQTARRLIQEAVLPFDNPDLRDALLATQSQRSEIIIDEISPDPLPFPDWDQEAREKAH
jgi:type I restriction enzyme R subunit